jgi:DNA-binding CsgD family transcriptional regulator
MSIPVPVHEDCPALIAHLVPVKRAAHDIFAGAFSVLVVTPLAAPQAPSEDLLNGLFDLTPAEARVAQAIVEGKTLEQLAATLCLSRETVRTQLKSVLAKTRVARQAELVGLLVGKKLPFHTFE